MHDLHYGWLVSPYSAKTRSYLTYIGHPFSDHPPSAFKLFGSIKGHVGRPVMPTMRLRDGRWLQDSSVIIDHFEALGTYPSVVPTTPIRRFLAYLLEVFADEWLPMVALHYRWNFEENARFALNEFAACALPFLPRSIGRVLSRPMANKMRGYLPILGVSGQTREAVEQTARVTIEVLERQLSVWPYILGKTPTIADFALYGPLWAHLFRDGGSLHLFKDAPRVIAWMNELTKGVKPVEYPEQDLDEVSMLEALVPLCGLILEDQWSWMATLIEQIDAYCRQNPESVRVPRSLGRAPFTMRGIRGERTLVTGVQWKAQRVIAHYDPQAIDPWLKTIRMPTVYPESRIMPPISNPLELRKGRLWLCQN